MDYVFYEFFYICMLYIKLKQKLKQNKMSAPEIKYDELMKRYQNSALPETVRAMQILNITNHEDFIALLNIVLDMPSQNGLPDFKTRMCTERKHLVCIGSEIEFFKLIAPISPIGGTGMEVERNWINFVFDVCHWIRMPLMPHEIEAYVQKMKEKGNAQPIQETQDPALMPPPVPPPVPPFVPPPMPPMQ